MATIVIRPATEADINDIARIHADALEPFARFSAALNTQNPRDALPELTKYAFGNPQNVYSVAVDTATGDTVGFLRYETVEPSGDASKAGQTTHAPRLKHKPHLDSIWKRLNDQREAEQDAIYEQTHNGRRHIYIAHLMVDPKHQRKGIGRKLLRTALDVSDSAAIPAIIVSSRESHPLYSSQGFEDVKVWITDNGCWAREIETCERELSIGVSEGLADAYAGFADEVALMSRSPRANT